MKTIYDGPQAATKKMGLLSVLILLGAVNAASLAALIVCARGNRHANRFLAGLLMLVGMRLAIYVLGFAGLYDEYRWLTFVPLDLSASFAPLHWLYVRAVVGTLPIRWKLHLVPAVIQFAYQAACFLLPASAKWAWYTGEHLHVVEPLAMAAILIAACLYVAASWQDQARYQRWLDTHFADREQWRLIWLRTMIAAFAALLLLIGAAVAWHVLIGPIDYFGRTPVMFAFCLQAYGLGLLGWRHGGDTYPPETRALNDAAEPRTDYSAVAASWAKRIEAEGWWREEGVTLGTVADRLGTSERSLSRALNDGAGRSFNAVVNAMRVRAIQRALTDPDEKRDLLTLALDHGFASKASFNRAFRQAAGTTPSDWRRMIRQSPFPADSGAPAG